MTQITKQQQSSFSEYWESKDYNQGLNVDSAAVLK